MVSAEIARAIGNIPLPLGGGVAAVDHECEGSKHHSPTPLVVRQVRLCPWDKANTEKVWLCGTCADNLAVFHKLISELQEMPWPLRREFGNTIRALGERGWAMHLERGRRG